MTTVFAQVDAFTTTPFGGNPAAVCVLPGPAAPAWMAAGARETNLPATVFVHGSAEGFGVRWFTATTELQLCGHGTLAAAHVLYETGRLQPGEAAQFQSPNGRLSAHQADGWITLDFPAISEQR